jgi:hypothetical protein
MARGSSGRECCRGGCGCSNWLRAPWWKCVAGISDPNGNQKACALVGKRLSAFRYFGTQRADRTRNFTTRFGIELSFLSRALFDRLAGFDKCYEEAGGELVNLDFYARAVAAEPRSIPISFAVVKVRVWQTLPERQQQQAAFFRHSSFWRKREATLRIYEVATAPGFLFGVVVPSNDSKCSPASTPAMRRSGMSVAVRVGGGRHRLIDRRYPSAPLWRRL